MPQDSTGRYSYHRLPASSYESQMEQLRKQMEEATASQPEPEGWGHWAARTVVPSALRMGGAFGGATLGSMVAPFAGTAAGGFVGAGLGETAAQEYEKWLGTRQDLNPKEVLVQSAIGAIPVAKAAEGAGLLTKAALHGLHGAGLGAASEVGSSLAEKGELPTASDVGRAALISGAMGAGMGAAFGRERAPAPSTALERARPKVRWEPTRTEGVPPTAETVYDVSSGPVPERAVPPRQPPQRVLPGDVGPVEGPIPPSRRLPEPPGRAFYSKLDDKDLLGMHEMGDPGAWQEMIQRGLVHEAGPSSLGSVVEAPPPAHAKGLGAAPATIAPAPEPPPALGEIAPIVPPKPVGRGRTPAAMAQLGMGRASEETARIPPVAPLQAEGPMLRRPPYAGIPRQAAPPPSVSAALGEVAPIGEPAPAPPPIRQPAPPPAPTTLADRRAAVAEVSRKARAAIAEQAAAEQAAPPRATLPPEEAPVAAPPPRKVLRAKAQPAATQQPLGPNEYWLDDWKNEQIKQGFTPADAEEAVKRLQQAGIVEVTPRGTIKLREEAPPVAAPAPAPPKPKAPRIRPSRTAPPPMEPQATPISSPIGEVAPIEAPPPEPSPKTAGLPASWGNIAEAYGEKPVPGKGPSKTQQSMIDAVLGKGGTEETIPRGAKGPTREQAALTSWRQEMINSGENKAEIRSLVDQARSVGVDPTVADDLNELRYMIEQKGAAPPQATEGLGARARRKLKQAGKSIKEKMGDEGGWVLLEGGRKPVTDESGRVIAPPQTEIPPRPAGPWDQNAPVGDVGEVPPKGPGLGSRLWEKYKKSPFGSEQGAVTLEGGRPAEGPTLAQQVKKYATKAKWGAQDVGAWVGDRLGEARAYKAGLDVSGTLRQGGHFRGRPFFYQTLPNAYKTLMSAEGEQSARQFLESHPKYQQAKAAGVFFSNAKELEDKIVSRAAETGPFGEGKVGQAYQKSIGEAYKRTNAYHEVFLNELRLRAFDKLTQNAKPEEIPAIAKYINSATGRGRLTVSNPLTGRTHDFEPAANFLNKTFFSARFAKSRMELMNPALYTTKNKPLLIAAWRDLATNVGYVTAVNALAHASGLGGVTIDPRSPDFGKLTIGKSRIDFSNGMQPYIRILAQMATMSKVSSVTGKEQELNTGKFGAPTLLDTIERFGEGKLAPLPGAAFNAMRGKKVTGEPISYTSPNPFENEISGMFTPMLADDVYHLTQPDPQAPVATRAAMALGAALGESVQTYGEDKEKTTGGGFGKPHTRRVPRLPLVYTK